MNNQEEEIWNLYRNGKPEEALKMVEAIYGPEDLKGIEISAQICAAMGKDFPIEEMLKKMPENSRIMNALAIQAIRDESIDPEMIYKLALKFVQGKGNSVANIFHNAGRVLLNQPNKAAITKAIGLFHMALCKYGYDSKNYHHCATVYFWLSYAWEKLENRAIACWAAEQSLLLWEKQAVLAPENEVFKQKLANARKRLSELKN